MEDRVLRDFLIDAGLVSRRHLDEALQNAEGRPLSVAVVEAGLLGADDLARASAHAFGVPFVIIDRFAIEPEALELIPEPLSRAHNMVAYKVIRGEGSPQVEVALLDLANLDELDFLRRTHRVLPRLTTRESLRHALLRYQRHLKEKFGDWLMSGMHAVDALIKHAIYSRAGGVHIEPAVYGTLVRHQIDHTLHEAMRLPEQVGKSLVGQLKSLAKMLPVQRPQEGRFKVEHDGDVVHVHVSSIPTVGGEKIKLRLARASHGQKGYTLESLGFHGEGLDEVNRALARRKGIIAVVGNSGASPSISLGAGKTTLLYTLLDLLSSPHSSLATIEEQVSQRLPHIAQVQTSADISPSSALRAVLRQDPDIVMIDEIKDTETATLAQSAAKRGILVLASVADGVDLVADTTIKLALVKRLCTKHFADTAKLSRSQGEALEPYTDFARVFNALKEEGIIEKGLAWKDVQFVRPIGCSQCADGYKGHVGIHEVMRNETLAGLSLIEDGLFKAVEGLTSVDEVISLLG
jgi:type IV pilus assembly protein PilB